MTDGKSLAGRPIENVESPFVNCTKITSSEENDYTAECLLISIFPRKL